MKLKRIISLIESLNLEETKQLISHLKEKTDLNKYNSEIQKLIERRDVEKIAWMIEKGELKETKEILMIQNNYGQSVAHYLADNSGKTKWSTDDKDILMIQDKNGDSVAHILALYSGTTKWFIEDKNILKLKNKKGYTVAHNLAGAALNLKEIDRFLIDKEILKWKTLSGVSVAHMQAHYSNITKWLTYDKEILMLQDKNEWSVAHELAYYHPTWITNDIEILSLMDKYGETIEDWLKKVNKV